MQVSVVIPMYNAGRWIKETLESIYLQNYRKDDIQIVITDDESTDDGPNIARAFFQERSMNGHIVPNKRNGGCGAPRNAAMHLVTADWVQFVDADDILLPNKFDLQMTCAAHAPSSVGVIYSPWRHYVLENGTWAPGGEMVVSHIEPDPLVRILGDSQFGFVGPTLVRKSFAQSLNYFNGDILLGEDFDFMTRAAMVGPSFCRALSTEPAFLYRSTPGSMWRKAIGKIGPMKQCIQISRRAELYLRQKFPDGLSREARRALGERYARFLDFFAEYDAPAYRETLSWIHALEAIEPPGLGKGMRVVSNLVGYDRAVSLRLGYRKARRKLDSLRGDE